MDVVQWGNREIIADIVVDWIESRLKSDRYWDRGIRLQLPYIQCLGEHAVESTTRLSGGGTTKRRSLGVGEAILVGSLGR